MNGVIVKEGVAAQSEVARKFQSEDEEIERTPTRFEIAGGLKLRHGVETDNFMYLASVTHRTPKICIPSPTILHMRGGRNAIDKHAYPDMEGYYAERSARYREEIRALANLGYTFLQLDDPNMGYLCDEKMREGVRGIGEDPNQLPGTYTRLINECIKDRPDKMTVCMHVTSSLGGCRSSSVCRWLKASARRSAWRHCSPAWD